MSDDSDDICRWCLKRKGEHIPHGWHFMCPPHVGSSTKYEPVQQFSKPTQRAPVEQGRDELQELKLSSEGGRSGSSHPVTLLSSPSPASVDHAREGALRELAKAPDTDAIVQVDADGLFRYTTRISNAQLKEWRRLAENTTMVSGMGEYTPQSEVIALIDEVEQLRRALADGKEGGE